MSEADDLLDVGTTTRNVSRKAKQAVGNIAPPLISLAVPTDTLAPHPENYRQGNVEAIAASLTRFGQVRPILVQASTRQIVAGNHTFAAALSLGWNVIAAASVDMTDEEARAYLVADNRLSDLATNDDTALGTILAGLSETGNLEGTGFDQEDVDLLLRSLAELPEPELGPADLPPVVKPDPEAARLKAEEEERERVSGSGKMASRTYTFVLTTEQSAKFDADFKAVARIYETTGIGQTVLALVDDTLKRHRSPVVK